MSLRPFVTSAAIVAGAALMTLFSAGCPSRPAEGLDPSKVPETVRADYDVFAQRCSRCHSLARPLDSGITEDEYWQTYVERMRRMPSSGISQTDATVILRFLHWYSQAKIAEKKAKAGG